jgi:hypothetical protein
LMVAMSLIVMTGKQLVLRTEEWDDSGFDCCPS